MLLILSLLAACVPSDALAQSKGTMKRANRVLATPLDEDRLREIFRELSVELRAAPEEATAAGWWRRGEIAAQLTLMDERPITMASIALDSFNEALLLDAITPTVAGLDAIESVLLPLARPASKRSTHSQFEAAEQLLVAAEIRRRIAANGGAPTHPVDTARIKAIAVQAALNDDQLRIARKVYLDLDAQGGLMEPLALQITERLNDERGPQQAFIFLTHLIESHPNRRKLLIRYVELCAKNGWYEEAGHGLTGAVPRMKDTYEDHLFLARNFELLQHIERAESHYKLALRLAPKGFEANAGYAKLLQGMANNLPSKDDVPSALAITYRRRAVDALNIALKSNPTNTEALARLIELYHDLEDGPAAEEAEARLLAAKN